MTPHSPRFRLTAATLCVTAACSAFAQRAESPASVEELESLLNQPVYAASKFAQDAAEAPAAVTVLTAGDIRAYGWQTLSAVLNAVRGVSLRDDRLYTYAGVRGFSPPGDYTSRILVLIDGMRVNENIYDQASTGREFPLSVELIERVEVIAGPGSALYGSNAVLAVVNVITKSSASLAGSSAGFGLGSQGSRSLSARHGARLGDGYLLIAGRSEARPGGDHYYAEYNTPGTNNGNSVAHDSERDKKLYAKWTQGGISATLIASERFKDVPTGAFAVDFNTPVNNIDRYLMADLQWQWEGSADSQLYARATLARYRYLSTQVFDGAAYFYNTDGQWAATEVRWQYSGWAGHRWVVGVEGQRNINQHQVAGYFPRGTPLDADVRGKGGRYAAFVNDEWSVWPGWRLTLGGRLDRLLDGSSNATPRLGVVWQAAPGLNVKLLNGRAFREPNAFESQYSDGVIQINNPNLKVERLSANELAADWRVMPSLRLAASVYRYRVKQLISATEDPATKLVTFINVGQAQARGSELELDHIGENGWRTRASLSLQDATSADGQPLPNSPRSLFKLHVTGPLPWSGWRLGIEGHRVGHRSTVASTDVAPYFVVHGNLVWSPPTSSWSLGLSAQNLLNKRFVDPAGPEHLQQTLLRDGRTWSLQANYGF
jgi:outer membrane receptor protein involved in Fe transport